MGLSFSPGILAMRVCMDCHSNETRWPWYSRVGPVSWLVVFDVYRGRRGWELLCKQLYKIRWGTDRGRRNFLEFICLSSLSSIL